MSKILLAGNDLRLLATRAAVLSRLGCSVQWGSSHAAQFELEHEAFEVLVLCHSLTVSQRAMLISHAKLRSPETLVLQLLVSPYDQAPIERVSDIRTSICEPHHLLQQMRALLEESRYRHPQIPVNAPHPVILQNWQHSQAEIGASRHAPGGA